MGDMNENLTNYIRSEIGHELARLEDIAGTLLKFAPKDQLSDEAINWSKLSCESAELWVSRDDSGYRVTITGASPDASKLRQYLINRFDECGEDVDVVVGW